ncbi:Toxic cation resistance protein, partial [Streptomyces sp. NPDC048297]
MIDGISSREGFALMGILTLLRNAFGRGRKSRTAEAESAGQQPSQNTATPQLPDPRTEDPALQEHDLVTAAFDNITVPRQSTPVTGPEAVPEVKVATETEAVTEAEGKVAAETEPAAGKNPAAKPEPVPEAEAEPVAEEEPTAQVEA